MVQSQSALQLKIKYPFFLQLVPINYFSDIQAIGRAHRQGQTKMITVVRFLMKNTVEHEFYLENKNLSDTDGNASTVIANAPPLKRSQSLKYFYWPLNLILF